MRVISVDLEDVALFDSEGWWYANAPCVQLDVWVVHEHHWGIEAVRICAQKDGRTRTFRTLSPKENAAEFHFTKEELLRAGSTFRFIEGKVRTSLMDAA